MSRAFPECTLSPRAAQHVLLSPVPLSPKLLSPKLLSPGAAPTMRARKKKRVPQGNALFFRNGACSLVHIEHFGAVDRSKLAVGWQDAGIAH